MSGQYRVGQRLPSEVDLVRTFSTSRLTVNRALRELQVAGLIERKVGSGSYVKKTLDKGYSFGLLIPDLGRTEVFEPICRGMAEARLGDPHTLLWGSLPSDAAALEQQARASCQQWATAKVSGVFFAPLELADGKDAVNHRIVDMLTAAGIPVVLIDRDLVPYPQRSQHDLVGIDNRRAGYVLAQHMIQRGCRRLIFVGRHGAAPSCLARAVGFRDALQAADLPWNDTLVLHRTDPANADEVARFMSALRPDGIVCSNDFTAALLMRTLEAMSIRVPEDVLMGGFDDVKYANLLPVPLTTIRQPCAAIGAAAAMAMVERTRTPDLPPRDILLNFELVVRASTGIRDISDASVPVPAEVAAV